jgi:molybdate transport system substrate-binding protein
VRYRFPVRALAAGVMLAGLAAAPLAARPAAARHAPDGELLVSAAACLTNALTEIARQYERARGGRVVLNVGSSSGLARQIVNGAPVDVFLSADEAQMDAVAAAGLLDNASRADLLSNQLVIVVPAGRTPFAAPRDLTAASIRHVALADTAAVPAGV